MAERAKRAAPFSFRLSEDLRAQLEAAKGENGSIAQEIERRLRLSFLRGDPKFRTVEDALARGKEIYESLAGDELGARKNIVETVLRLFQELGIIKFDG